MRSFREEWFFVFLYLLFNAIILESFFEAFDVYGFFVGAYGLLLPWPTNLIFSQFFIIGTLFIGLITFKFFKILNSKYALYLGIGTSFFIFGITIRANMLVSVIYDFGILMLVYSVFRQIEYNDNKTISSLDKFQQFLILLISIEILVMFILFLNWTINGTTVSTGYRYYSSHALILSWTNNVPMNTRYDGYIAPYLDSKNHGNLFLLGIKLSHIVRGILFSLLIYKMFQRINLWREILEREGKILSVRTINNEYYLYETSFVGSELTLDNLLSKNSFTKHLDHINDIVDLIQHDGYFLFEGSSNPMDWNSINQLNFNIETQIQKNGRSLFNISNLQSLFDEKNNKSPILLFNPFEVTFPFNFLFYQNKEFYYPISRKLYPIGIIEGIGLPVVFPRVKKILHVGSQNLNSQLLMRKITHLTQHENLRLEQLNISEKSNFSNITEVSEEDFDILLISMHSKTIEGVTYYYYGGYNEEERITSAEFLEKFIKIPPIVLLPTCQSYSYDLENNFPIQLIKKGALLTLSSSSDILSSHLSLITLSALEDLLELRYLNVYRVRDLQKAIYQSIRKFGFEIQTIFLYFLIKVDFSA